MGEENINELFETLSAAVRQPPRPVEEPPKPAPVKAPSQDELREAFDPNSENFNPGQAIETYIQAQYGPLVGDINRRSVNALYAGFRAQYPDFQDHEGDISGLLQNVPPVQLNETHVMNAYLISKGAKSLRRETEDRKKAAQSVTTTVPPSAPVVESGEVELSPVEQEVAKKMFYKYDDPIAKYKEYRAKVESGQTFMKVPIGEGKKE